jgi:hypothetical protein
VLSVSSHALQRLGERGITREDLESALARRVRKEPGTAGSVWIFGHSRAGRIVKVCVRVDDETFVITAAWPDE